MIDGDTVISPTSLLFDNRQTGTNQPVWSRRFDVTSMMCLTSYLLKDIQQSYGPLRS